MKIYKQYCKHCGLDMDTLYLGNIERIKELAKCPKCGKEPSFIEMEEN